MYLVQELINREVIGGGSNGSLNWTCLIQKPYYEMFTLRCLQFCSNVEMLLNVFHHGIDVQAFTRVNPLGNFHALIAQNLTLFFHFLSAFTQQLFQVHHHYKEVKDNNYSFLQVDYFVNNYCIFFVEIVDIDTASSSFHEEFEEIPYVHNRYLVANLSNFADSMASDKSDDMDNFEEQSFDVEEGDNYYSPLGSSYAVASFEMIVASFELISYCCSSLIVYFNSSWLVYSH